MAHRRSGLQHPASNFKRQASNLEHCNTLLATPSGQLCYDLRAMNPRHLMLYLMLIPPPPPPGAPPVESGGPAPAPPTSGEVPPQTSATPTIHIVQSGDTLGR